MAVHEDEYEERRIAPLALLVARGQGATKPRRGSTRVRRRGHAPAPGQGTRTPLPSRSHARDLRAKPPLWRPSRSPTATAMLGMKAVAAALEIWPPRV